MEELFSPQSGLPGMESINLLDLWATTAEIAEFYGKDIRSVQYWVKDMRLRSNSNGQYRVCDVVRGLDRHKDDLINKKKGPEGEKLQEWELMEQKEKAWERYLRNQKIEKKFVPLDFVEKELARVFVTFKDNLRALKKALSEPLVRELIRIMEPCIVEEIPANIEREMIIETEKTFGTSIDECLAGLSTDSESLRNPNGYSEDGDQGGDLSIEEPDSTTAEPENLPMG